MLIHGLTAAPTTPLPASRPRTAVPVAAQPPADGYAGSVGSAPEAAAEAPSLPTASVVGLGQRFVLAALTGLTVLGALGLAAPAMASEPASSQASVSRSDDRAEARRYGLSDRTAQRLETRPDLVESLRALPPEIASAYRGMSEAQRRVTFQEITGTTRIGLISIQNRKAFVAGQVMGVDALPRMHDSIDRRVEAGDLTAPEGEALKANLTRMSRLTPAQREAIATVIEWEGPPK